MTIKEINGLVIDEVTGRLRKPKTLVGLTNEEIFNMRQTFLIIVKKIINNPNRDEILNSLIWKANMKSVGIEKIEIANRDIGSYNIKTKYGEGIFFDAHRLFVDGNYPQWITPKYCFSNSFFYVMRTGLDAKVESGIAYDKQPFLHSVVLIGDYIVDFNYDLVMEKNLYCALTHFEILEELESEKIVGAKRFCLEHKELFSKVEDCVMNFAFDEVIKNAKKQLDGILSTQTDVKI